MLWCLKFDLHLIIIDIFLGKSSWISIDRHITHIYRRYYLQVLLAYDSWGEKSYECDNCNEVFSSNKVLNEHKMMELIRSKEAIITNVQNKPA